MIYCVPSQLALCSPCLDRYLPLPLIDLWREQHPEAAVAEQLPLAWEAGASASGRPLGRDRHSLDLTVTTKEGEDPQEREALLFFLLVMNLLYPNPSSRSASCKFRMSRRLIRHLLIAISLVIICYVCYRLKTRRILAPGCNCFSNSQCSPGQLCVADCDNDDQGTCQKIRQ